jgi:hypothetical protein
MAYFGDQADALFTDAFNKFAESSESMEFVSAPAECAAEHIDMNQNAAPTPGVVLFRNFDTPVHFYSGAANKEDLAKFAKGLSTPTLFEFSEDYVGAIFDEQQPILIYFNDNKPTKVLEEAADQLKGKILFSYSGVTDEF